MYANEINDSISFFCVNRRYKEIVKAHPKTRMYSLICCISKRFHMVYHRSLPITNTFVKENFVSLLNSNLDNNLDNATRIKCVSNFFV